MNGGLQTENMPQKLYHRTRYLKHMIVLDFYDNKQCKGSITARSRISNFKTEKLSVDVLSEWYHKSDVNPKHFKDKELIWLDKIEITEHRLCGFFRPIIKTTLAKIRKLHNTPAIIGLEAYSLDQDYGPSTRKLVAIYKEFGFEKVKNTTTRCCTIMTMRK